MDYKLLYQKPIAAIKWCFTKIVNTIKWSVNKVVSFVKWNGDTISAVWQWIVKYVQMIGRFWYGIIFMTVGAKLASANLGALAQFLKGRTTDGNLAFGLALIAIGFICVIFSADWSRFRLWGDSK